MAAVRGALAGLLRPLRAWAGAPLALGRPRSARFASGLSVPCVGRARTPVAAPAKTLPLPSIRPAGGGAASVLSSVTSLLPSILQQPVRTLTYCSLRNGKRKTVKAVVERFLRLHNGLWVRRRAGYKKKLWKKSAAQKKRLRELVLCNRTQCKLLDKMTTSFWKRRNWYVDDPYQKYHDRTNLRI
ncbi:large ribosomal subunit protein bL35m [Dromaius novaehollandiae]|uniref:large ribosomal subunit protein bL35m n=1 Tax=Dromaius novaehollandiae TaxID=8790 RepID=UPI000E1FA9DA|nr:39S ribosomal protein L35, mitochondrial [Dromaius novaehollandiae]